MSNLPHLKEWLQLPNATKLNIFRETGRKMGLPPVAIEKDWWMVHSLAIVFSLDCANALVFKGGTSLSKGWNLIQRFSEDIDLALNREYIGFKGELSKSDIRRLRKASYNFITTKFTEELKTRFFNVGFTEVSIKYREVINHDQDPMIIEIYYPKLTEADTYLKPGLLLEVGSRSLMEPHTAIALRTFAAENYPELPFADSPIIIPVVNPERTFLEKIFLLHEEFQRPQDKIRVGRLSRHLYDIEKLMKTSHAETAFQNANLFDAIAAHRSKFTPVSGVDYSKHSPGNIRFIPPEELLPKWENDYKQMQENMIYGETLTFAELIKNLTELQATINNLKWS